MNSCVADGVTFRKLDRQAKRGRTLSSGDWYVWIEEGRTVGGSDEFMVTSVEYVAEGREHARQKALGLAKSHFPRGYYREFVRSVFSSGSDSFVVAFRNERGRVQGSFRVSVGDLIHVEEPAVQIDAPGNDAKKGILGRAFRKD